MAIKKGIYAASMSIFNQDLSLDIDSTINHSEKLIQEGCHGCVLFGSTGQAQLISSREKKKLIEKLHNNKFKDYLSKIFLVFRFNSSRTLFFSASLSWFMVSPMSGFSFTVIFEIF